jgi:hypothetical protein
MTEKSTVRKSKRGSIFFPLLLIIIGLVFLLSNMEMIDGDAWSLLLQFWPVLLVVIGLDSIYKREGFVAATFFIGLGIIFLLANLGYLNVSVWQLVFTLWPIFLIAIGFDILIGKRSIWASIAGVILVLVILFGALWLYGVGIETGQIPAGENINQQLDGAVQADVFVEAGAGELLFNGMESAELLIRGTIPAEVDQRITSSYMVKNGRGVYRLRQTGESFMVPIGMTGKWTWDLEINQEIPMGLDVSLGAGDLEANLSELNLDSLSVNLGIGSGIVTLPGGASFDATVEGAIGQLAILVPNGVGVRVIANTGLATLHVPDGYVRIGDAYQSPGYSSSDTRIDLNVSMAIGTISIREEE